MSLGSFYNQLVGADTSTEKSHPPSKKQQTTLSLEAMIPTITFQIPTVKMSCSPEELPMGGPCDASCFYSEEPINVDLATPIENTAVIDLLKNPSNRPYIQSTFQIKSEKETNEELDAVLNNAVK